MAASPQPTRYQAWVQASPIRGLAVASIVITLLILAFVFVATPFSWGTAAKVSGLSVFTVLVVAAWCFVVLWVAKTVARKLPKPLTSASRATFGLCFLIALIGGGYLLEMAVMAVINRFGGAQ